jgi:hypothetical protein
MCVSFSHTFEEVHEKSKFHWALLQTGFLEEYSVKSIFPIHFQLLVLPALLVHALIWIIHYAYTKIDCTQHIDSIKGYQKHTDEEEDKDDGLNCGPMFIRG